MHFLGKLFSRISSKWIIVTVKRDETKDEVNVVGITQKRLQNNRQNALVNLREKVVFYVVMRRKITPGLDCFLSAKSYHTIFTQVFN